MYKTIGVDCDDVLSQTMKLLTTTTYFKNRNVKFQNLHSYSLDEIVELQMTRQDAHDAFYNLFKSDKFWELKPIKGALPVLQKRKKEGKKLIIVTGRPSELKEKTMARIQHYFPDIFDDGLFAGEDTAHEKTKVELCREAGVEMMIEDRLPIVRELAENGIPCLLLKNPWNEYPNGFSGHPNIIKVQNWAEIGKIV